MLEGMFGFEVALKRFGLARKLALGFLILLCPYPKGAQAPCSYLIA